MPPRYAYWTILIDQKPTAFRARDREDLVPTFVQLKRANPQIEMKWFARGRLWDSPEQASWAQTQPRARRETRDRSWRPGGSHSDPRSVVRRNASKTPSGGQRRSRTSQSRSKPKR